MKQLRISLVDDDGLFVRDSQSGTYVSLHEIVGTTHSFMVVAIFGQHPVSP